MKARVQEKERAIELRKKGLSYNDILREIPVAKSTLSNWLKDLPLTKDEKGYLKTRMNSNISRGRIKAAAANRKNRHLKEQAWRKVAEELFYLYEDNPFFYTGVALYWAEGSKRSSACSFVNSDFIMVNLFVRWLEVFASVPRTSLYLRLYIHKHYAHENCEQFWARELKVPIEQFKKTVYK